MSSPTNIAARIWTLTAVLPDPQEQQAVETALTESHGDWSQAQQVLTSTLPPASMARLTLANTLAEWSGDHVPLVRALVEDPAVTDLRDVALNYSLAGLASALNPDELPPQMPGASPEEVRQHTAVELRRRLFAAEPTAVLQRMVADAEVPTTPAVRDGVTAFLANQPDLNLRVTSVYTAFQQPGAFSGIAPEDHAAVTDTVKTLQRVLAITSVPEAIPALMDTGLTSAFSVAQVPESTFVRAFGPALGEDHALLVHTNATNAHIRNESALASMRETVRGSGLAIIDGTSTLDDRVAAFAAAAEHTSSPVNLHDLFGSIDHCECDDCLSIYSPAAYFVELLQFLRNNNLDKKDPNTTGPTAINPDPKSIDGTPLQMLLRRRPDLKCLELTCENTFTVLPYIDLVNEVMESFVVHLDSYTADMHKPKQASIDVFNVGDETTGELLAQPQHVNYHAYCTLKNAVYPSTLPYSEPLDVSRTWLPALGTSRSEILDTFRTHTEKCDGVALTPDQLTQLAKLHGQAIDRALDAEYFKIPQEEYIILTGEAFWSKDYFELTTQTGLSTQGYRERIGVRPVYEYFGYPTKPGADGTAEMLSVEEGLTDADKVGLTFVELQFLPRTGIHYTDLVELVKTWFVNPAYPTGKALTLMDSIRFSYRFLQTLVDPADPHGRYAKLIAFLDTYQPLVPEIEALLHPDPCHTQDARDSISCAEFTDWVECYFERIGKLIVLDSGEGPRLPDTVVGTLVTPLNGDSHPVGALDSYGAIVDGQGAPLGSVNYKGVALCIGPPQQPLPIALGQTSLTIKDANGVTMGHIDRDGHLWGKVPGTHDEEQVTWLPVRDKCELSRVRLTHLNGSALTPAEYDRIQRFIRLWHDTGWSIDQLDQALAALSTPPEDSTSSECEFVGFDAFTDTCEDTTTTGDPGGASTCPPVASPPDITVDTVHQLVTIAKLAERTGLGLDILLSFWGDIGTSGQHSLYARLFLTHNVRGIDPVFVADVNGNVLTGSETLSKHLPVVLAALKLTAADVAAVVALRALPDELTLRTVSALYRHRVLAGLLGVKVSELVRVIALFTDPDPDPFTSPDSTWRLLTSWQDMSDAGFTYRQLDYIIRDYDDPRRPLGPSTRAVLQTTRTLYDGLEAIDRDHPDLTDGVTATDDMVSAAATLVFAPGDVPNILGLLDGTTVYTTNAPANLTLTIPPTLTKRVAYIPAKDATGARLQLTGILTAEDTAAAAALSTNPGWAAAIERAGRQASHAGHIFHDALAAFLPPDAATVLLAGDVNPTPNPGNPAAGDTATAPGKRLYFLRNFLPYLRALLARKLIIDTMSAAAGLSTEATDVLLSELLWVNTPGNSALQVLQAIHQAPTGAPAGWRGYLIPTAAASYTFVAVNSDTAPAPITLDGASIAFPHQQDDPSNVWSSDPVPLHAATLYTLNTNGLPIEGLYWKTPTASATAIPGSALLPDYSTQGTTEVFTKLTKSALLVNGFTLTPGEARYLQHHHDDFDGLNFNTITLKAWRRLRAYTALRDSLPRATSTLLDLFGWASNPPAHPGATALPDRIVAVTGWDRDSLISLLAAQHFDLDHPEAFRNETALVTLRKAFGVLTKTAVAVDRVFSWANPASRFWPAHHIATDIQAALRARYNQTTWEQAVKPLYDQLREHQKIALIAYLLPQPALRAWGVTDADSLFEFFLIDVQMSACLDTSRIKQAISTVQTYVQRCLLGLEAENGVAAEVLDRARWDWMSKYRVWEANRKVFAYPENWINAELRDDKSPFFEELEAELLQKDINPATVEDALRAYVSKVDTIANIQVVGIFLDKPASKLHIFARTRNAPHLFYYRYYTTADRYWYPWESVTVDIPSYDVEVTQNNVVTLGKNGAYLIPVVWNNHLLIFFPLYLRKAAPKQSGQTFTAIGGDKASDHQSLAYWEIRMAWSEYRNGKWSQKQVSTGAVYDATPTTDLLDIRYYNFIPRLVRTPESKVVIDVYYRPQTENALGRFELSGGHISAAATGSVPALDIDNYTEFTYLFNGELHSLQGEGQVAPVYAVTPPFFAETVVDGSVTSVTFTEWIGQVPVNAYDSIVHDLIGKLAGENLDALFDYYLALPKAKEVDVYGLYITDTFTTSYHELKAPYALYNWEPAFHAPMLLVDRLLAAGQFDLALRMIHYVLNPFAPNTPATATAPADPIWRFLPFRNTDPQNDLEALFLSLKPNAPDSRITEWRNHPFQPHVIARGRPVAYMKWVAMTYIRIWIAYGDYYFRQNTLEALPLAIQCYVVAAHVYGPRGELITKRGKTVPQTYASLLDKWDAFSNAMVELELAFPFSNQTRFPIGESNGVVGLANIFGFATTLYFCIPDNPDLTALRDLIDDRLFKVRHCQDIKGVYRQLPLFEAPIDPALLVQAAAQGVSLSSVLNDLNAPMPNYRFTYLLQKAFELCAELKTLGNAMLAAKEKHDAEALAQLRATHDTTINTLIMSVRTQQADEAAKTLEGLQQNRKSPVYRLQHQLKLIGQDMSAVPADATTEFTELADEIEQPSTDSGLKLIPFEKEEMDKAADARDKQVAVSAIETLASIFHAIPQLGGYVTPIGVGATATWGGSNLGSLTEAVARSLQIGVNDVSFQSTNAGRKAGFLRQLQERIQQANIAGYEITNIDKQILTQNIRIAIAAQEITNQQKQIDNAQAVEDFLSSKYTNTELYSYLDTQTRGLYYRTYTMAYELAKKAEKLFEFERGPAAPGPFIENGYWNPGYDGLLAGEQLYAALKRLEAAHQENRAYDFEVTKPISLRQLDPLALLALRDSGSCEFTVPEVLFDMDYPGHYMRRIKSVAVTVPAVVGPYTSVNATLRLVEHQFRNTAIVAGKDAYPHTPDGDDPRFTTTNVPITAIAVSTGQNDSGVFELNFRDERYIPFEGAGAISKWRLELPDDFRQFDYDTITDVVMQLRYTSVDGGDALAVPAKASMNSFIKSVTDLGRQEGLFAAFDLRHDFPDAWYKATHAQPVQMTLADLNDRLPFFTRSHPAAKVQATDLYLYTAVHPVPTTVTVTQGNNSPIALNRDTTSEKVALFTANELTGLAMNTWQLQFEGTDLSFETAWLVIRYTLVA